MDKLDIERIIQQYRFGIIKNILKKDNYFMDTITGIKITASTNNIKIIYNHHSDDYNINDYCLHEDSEDEDLVSLSNKITRIEFGFINDKFYISGKTPLKVYTRRDNVATPFLCSLTYEHLLDEYEQNTLLDKYMNNKNIPEWFVISIFKAIKLNYININDLIRNMCFD